MGPAVAAVCFTDAVLPNCLDNSDGGEMMANNPICQNKNCPTTLERIKQGYCCPKCNSLYHVGQDGSLTMIWNGLTCQVNKGATVLNT
jgi:hypothetical protein